ncbi:hypothetical protein AUK04_00710 [Candidatus Roizmanbacteria bacterium CG2_30_33_16]|uniref:Uncharacterized protein n=4 Tax=Candidatus Roizmaniibacteriota TaxID=1752723 RepID=A0A2M7E4L3_9BACT|nr:hypothetical protein [Candidatus Roizmanbacteria bacterium]OIP86394.1 MAG: hypothetical protein AUK04_00710 [Candidatus Roizmanbacteria bacterium CG2_30_33_16]PIV62648.1 MAG: hypothetical protein COS12_01580 [Candidatus Roizmanbacteria bacterium CG01_land_8_20_14_3_00_33_9]PIX69924.1 MAG: hypothetical protein COZ39_04980 [Candidatus Roizmanbacteria bacterium CG_4_10_14_3_um_filter_33_21]PJB88235.1 MAG: hypothetical protein CO083_02845 [Candidatus Roizmanbacteria bacterium CG_4_9_14_0_8_um_fi
MTIYHKNLQPRWKEFSIYEQMANIGAEVGRAINWRKKKNQEMSQMAFYRALELIDFTVCDKKNNIRLQEILRIREVLVDDFFGDNIYQSSDDWWEKYFYYFNLVARNNSNGSTIS